MKLVLLLLLLCLTAGPVLTVSADDYAGGSIQLGGSGTGITRVTTADTVTAAATVPPGVIAATGSLSITTTPAGVYIFIDGVRQGTSPATISGLSPGSHTLLLKRDGYQDLSAPVTITAGQTQEYITGLLPAVTPLPAQPAATRSPGFGVIFGIAALGTLLWVRISRH